MGHGLGEHLHNFCSQVVLNVRASENFSLRTPTESPPGPLYDFNVATECRVIIISINVNPCSSLR